MSLTAPVTSVIAPVISVTPLLLASRHFYKHHIHVIRVLPLFSYEHHALGTSVTTSPVASGYSKERTCGAFHLMASRVTKATLFHKFSINLTIKKCDKLQQLIHLLVYKLQLVLIGRHRWTI